MISKSLSTSEKWGALHAEAGKLAEFCQALYPLMVAHSDDWGCLQGDVFTIKHLIDPTSPRKLHDFERALMHMHNVGLVTWYESEERKVVYIRGFSCHQDLKGHDKDGRKRLLPAPPDNPSKFSSSPQSSPISPKPPLREEKRREEKRSVLSHSADAEVTAHGVDEDLDTDEAVTGRDVHVVIRRFCELYAKHRYGAKYHVRSQKDVPLLRGLLRTYTVAELEKMVVVLLTTDEEFTANTDRGIGILSVKASKLHSLISEYESAHGVIQVAS